MTAMIRPDFFRRGAVLCAALAAVLLVGPELLAAQAQLPGASVGQQSLRPYWHVFIAYAIVIALIGGWAFSIARRLRGIEDRLVD
jgi:CcmD family protein